MPPYKRRFVKKRYSRSRSVSRYRRRAPLLKRLRTRAYANLRTGGLLAIERKFSDCAYPDTVLATAGGSGAAGPGWQSDFSPTLLGPTIYRSATGTITTGLTLSALNVLGPGDSGSDRDGRQVINDSIHIRGGVSFGSVNGGTVDMSVFVNIVLVLDTQTNGAAPAGSAIFVNPGDAAAASRFANGASPFVNLANSKRFRILKHIRRVVAPSAVSGNAVASYASGGMLFAMDVPLKGMKTNYVADTSMTTSTVASIGDNGIFLFAWSDLSPMVVLSYNSRLRFRG